MPNATVVGLRSSQQCAASPLAEPAAERLSAAPVQHTPERGSSRLLGDTMALLDDTTATNRDAVDGASARGFPEHAVLPPDPDEGEPDTEVYPPTFYGCARFVSGLEV